MGSLDDPRMDDVLLATSELVANAVLHGEGTLTISVWPGDALRVVVTDDGGATPHLRRHHPDDERGRGLFLVDALTTRWGVIPKAIGQGKSVWFEVRAEPRPTRQASAVAGRWPFNAAGATPSHCFSIIWNPTPENGTF